MIDLLSILSTNTERDVLPHVIHNLANVLAQLVPANVGEHGFVPATDVVSDTARGDCVLIRHDAADGYSVAFVMVGHEGDPLGGFGTRLDLAHSTRIRCAPNWNSINPLHHRKFTFCLSR